MMLARVAEALYWTSRSLERAETSARLLEVTHAMDLEGGAAASDGDDEWAALVRVLGDFKAFSSTYGRADEASAGWFVAFSEENPSSIGATVAAARERARSIRDRLPSDVWEGLNAMYLDLGAWSSSRVHHEGIYAYCRAVRRHAYLVHGLVDNGMRRDDHWTFLRLGRFLERAQLSTRLLEVRTESLLTGDPAVRAPLDLHRWRALLAAAFAEDAYASAHPTGISAEAVVRFLSLDDRLPRSVAFCLGEIERSLESLIADRSMVHDARPLKRTREARELLRTLEGGLLLSELHGPLGTVRQYCRQIDQDVVDTCFSASYVRPGEGEYAQAQSQSQN
jgi:uncharacterized alpha-E superfamily protein